MKDLQRSVLSFLTRFEKKPKVYFDLHRKRNMAAIKEFFLKIISEDLPAGCKFVDDCTWSDLNMDQVFAAIDRTVTTPGEQQLYKILRFPLIQEAELKERERIISFLDQNGPKRLALLQELGKLGRTDHGVIEVLSRRLRGNGYARVFYSLFALLFILACLSFAVWGFKQYNSLFLVALFIANMYMHGRMSSEFQEQVLVVQYIGKMINRIPKLAAVLAGNLQDYAARLEELYLKCKQIGKKASVLTRVEGLDVVGDYLNIMLLVKERNYHAIASDIDRLKKEILELYALIGELDALAAVSLYRESLTVYAKPEFVPGRVLALEGAVHPLLDNPVANSLQVTGSGVMITGSNMSGKSTFLRIVGVNALLAQTILTCLAQKYTTSLYQIISAMSLNDNLVGGKSFYLGEAEAIQRIVKANRDDIPCLGLIDEIFKGTNPVERVNAAAEILDYLAAGNALTLVATHDLQLIPMVEGYESYYFKEDVGEQGLIFDYQIRKGISSTKNAIKILEFLGYPAELIQKINTRIDRMT
jgi:DNA mismatch repair ATPase MutS